MNVTNCSDEQCSILNVTGATVLKKRYSRQSPEKTTSQNKNNDEHPTDVGTQEGTDNDTNQTNHRITGHSASALGLPVVGAVLP